MNFDWGEGDIEYVEPLTELQKKIMVLWDRARYEMKREFRDFGITFDPNPIYETSLSKLFRAKVTKLTEVEHEKQKFREKYDNNDGNQTGKRRLSFSHEMEKKRKMEQELCLKTVIKWNNSYPTQILREISILKEIGKPKHPNIMQMIDVFDFPSCLIVAYQFYSSDLERYLMHRNRFINENVMRRVIFDVLNGLNFLHNEMSIMHRDLKPPNILMEGEENSVYPYRWVLGDFGLSKFIIPGKKNMDLGSPIGTFSFCDPEILSGRGDYGFYVDMWSLGCILVSMIRMGSFFRSKSSKIRRYRVTIQDMARLECVSILEDIMMKVGLPNKGHPVRETEFFRIIIQKNQQKVGTLLKRKNSKNFKKMLQKGVEGTDYLKVSDECLDMVTKLLEWDTNIRYNVKQALGHKWFENMKKKRERQIEVKRKKKTIQRRKGRTDSM